MNPLPAAEVGVAQQANLMLLAELTNKALKGFERVVELQLQAVKATLAETSDNTQKALAVKDVQELLALQVGLMQPTAEKMLSYHRHLYDIARATQAEFAKAAGAEFEAHNRRIQDLVDNLAQSAPSGSEAAVGALCSVITATNKWCEMMYQSATQAVEVAEQSVLAAAAKQAVEPATNTAKT
ncbi:phasin family protein [Cupriavidus sp. BIC8F]|uniref:phasin family protein n=1 Tax=Cupriavidus sp. BIC8F TaxID=3079014 RepID=UPI0029163A31|nr:phasin family protein [Cupriavidus sp. BIC8F]